ncbi:glycosyltransferase family 2 protein [Bradyrhizobium sp. B117]|uniref:glycosyltransferase family 2 protein n=1 Tax=Bradyrhizobium sp. B117 TaxID=3140246 RepID=UPI00318416ED
MRKSSRIDATAKAPAVSVIIPTFNGGSGLEPTIASLRQQTLRPVEIIVVDDGPTDQTRAIAEQARALGLVDMVIWHGTRCGRSPAINAGARFASGELILTVDADTIFDPPRWLGLRMHFAIPASVARVATLPSATNATRYGQGCKASST